MDVKDLKCGLLGAKLGHSYSPRIHSLLADYEYRLYEKTPDELKEFLLNGDWDGLNVTIPYKKTVLPYCSELSDTALAVGSVNTLVRKKDGSLYGDNTDAYGFQSLLEHHRIDPAGKKALILGSGGACAAVRYVLEQKQANVVVISRTGKDHYQNLSLHRDAALVVNTTPVGMYPENGKSPVDLNDLPELEAVLDLIYNPARTGLILQAEERGLICDGGLRMLVCQAQKSSERFLEGRGLKTEGTQDREALIRHVIQKLSSEMQNLILIGMPGCGKSSAAEKIAQLTGRKRLDMDELFTEMYGLTPARCITEKGEAAFRKMETEVIRTYAKESGAVISTGGGCVTVPENYPLLHQNGRIIWIRRDLNLLPTEGRPLSDKEKLQEMYDRRCPMYERFADDTVFNGHSPEETAKEILALCGQEEGQNA